MKIDNFIMTFAACGTFDSLLLYCLLLFIVLITYLYALLSTLTPTLHIPYIHNRAFTISVLNKEQKRNILPEATQLKLLSLVASMAS